MKACSSDVSFRFAIFFCLDRMSPYRLHYRENDDEDGYNPHLPFLEKNFFPWFLRTEDSNRTFKDEEAVHSASIATCDNSYSNHKGAKEEEYCKGYGDGKGKVEDEDSPRYSNDWAVDGDAFFFEANVDSCYLA